MVQCTSPYLTHGDFIKQITYYNLFFRVNISGLYTKQGFPMQPTQMDPWLVTLTKRAIFEGGVGGWRLPPGIALGSWGFPHVIIE